MARTLTALAAVTLSLALVGCSSPSTSTPSGTSPAPSDPVGAPGSAECSALTDEALGVYGLGIQILAQLRSQNQVDLVRDGTLKYDPEAMESSLLALRGFNPVPGSGEPSEAVDFYLGANDLAREILAIDGDVPQAKFDELIAYEGDLGNFIGRQLPINAAVSEACG